MKSSTSFKNKKLISDYLENLHKGSNLVIKYRMYAFPLFKTHFPDKAYLMYNVVSCSSCVGVNYLYYIEGAGENIIVDTGSPSEEIQASAPPGFVIEHVQSFEEALAKIGLKPADIDIVILTHLHHDHFLNVFKCVNAEIYVQEEEIRFAIVPHKFWAGIYASESAQKLLSAKNLRLVRGDVKVRDNLKILFTPGHTVGGQSVFVETEEGCVVIGGMCCLRENYYPPKPLNDRMEVIPPGIHTDLIKAYDSMVRLKSIAKYVIALHEPDNPEKIPG